MVQRVFARAGVRLIRDPEALVQTGAAFLEDATGDVQVNVSPAAEGTGYVIVNVTNGAEQPAHKALGNVWVDYLKHSLQTPRVLRALALLRDARPRGYGASRTVAPSDGVSSRSGDIPERWRSEKLFLINGQESAKIRRHVAELAQVNGHRFLGNPVCTRQVPQDDACLDS